MKMDEQPDRRTMRISVILAHPSIGSFNHAIAQTVVEQTQMLGHEVLYHDLYQERFDPLLSGAEIPKDAPLPGAVARHCEEIVAADGVVIVHPNWWGQPPAILKGWVDRVIRPGVAYEFLEGDAGEGVPNGLLKAKVAVVYNTANTAPERELNAFGDPLETIWRNCIFGLCGVTNVHRRTFAIVVTSTEAQRKNWLEEVKKDMSRIFPPAAASRTTRSRPQSK